MIALVVAGRRTAAREVALLLPNLVVLFKGLLGDRRVPRSPKALPLFGVAWIASPIDLIPEFVPFLGPLADPLGWGARRVRGGFDGKVRDIELFHEGQASRQLPSLAMPDGKRMERLIVDLDESR